MIKEICGGAGLLVGGGGGGGPVLKHRWIDPRILDEEVLTFFNSAFFVRHLNNLGFPSHLKEVVDYVRSVTVTLQTIRLCDRHTLFS